MIGIAIAIVIMYIQPKISSIRETQDLIANYETETENVSLVNQSLKAKISTIDALPPEDMQALNRFVPSTIDEISALKDLGIIIESQSIVDYDVAYKGNNVDQSNEEESISDYGPVTEHYFSVSFEADYQQLKSLLAQLETNDYMFEVSNLKITDTTTGLIQADMSLTVFTLVSKQEEVM